MDDSFDLSPKPTMGEGWSMPPPQPPPFDTQNYWKHDNTSVNAVSFGFVATAVLISMFLVLAIFERFLRPRRSFPPVSSIDTRESDAGEAPTRRAPVKRDDLIVERMYTPGVSVLMPGEEIPTFIANPVPLVHSVCSSLPTCDQGDIECCCINASPNVTSPSKLQDEAGAALVQSADTCV